MNINKLIACLRELQGDNGNVTVAISSDPEGNSFGTLTAEMSFDYDSETGVLVIYPVEQTVDLAELK